VLDHVAFNAFSDRWRANHGSVYGKAKNGQTMQQAWQAYQNSPVYKQTVQTPYTQLLRNGGFAKPPAKALGGPVRITGDADYAKLRSGAQFVGPDGVLRTKP